MSALQKLNRREYCFYVMFSPKNFFEMNKLWSQIISILDNVKLLQKTQLQLVSKNAKKIQYKYIRINIFHGKIGEKTMSMRYRYMYLL